MKGSADIERVVGETDSTQWNWWRVLPVTLVLGYRLFVYGSILYINPSCILRPTLYDSLVWIIALISVWFYLRTCCVDPGFQHWCPSQYLCLDEKRRALEVKTKLAEQGSKPQNRQRQSHGSQFLVSSDSDLESSMSELVEDSLPEYNSSDSDLECGEVDFSAEGAEIGFGATCIVSPEGEVYSDGSQYPKRKIRRLHIGNVESKPAANPSNSIALEVNNSAIKGTKELRSSPQIKAFRLRVLGHMVAFEIRQFWKWVRDWLFVCAVIYPGLLPRKESNCIIDKPQCEALFSMGVHAMYQNGEKLQFCDKCRRWKLLRAKHCRTCNKCVRLHDHHCPWLGVCIGERNRVYFLSFLGWQTLELILAVGEIILSVLVRNNDWIDEAKHPDATLGTVLPRIVLLVMIIVLACLAMMTICLFVYHSFLVGTNLTTWETLSWHKISYLKSKKKSHGSPFGSASCKSNCILAALPSITDNVRRTRLLKIDGVDQMLASRLVVGPGNAMLWKAKKPGDVEYAKLPPCTVNVCCNLYEVCL